MGIKLSPPESQKYKVVHVVILNTKEFLTKISQVVSTCSYLTQEKRLKQANYL